MKEAFRIKPSEYKIIPNPFLVGEIIFLAQNYGERIVGGESDRGGLDQSKSPEENGGREESLSERHRPVGL